MVKPENTTIEAQYVANTVGEALSKALAELVEKRPVDPIEYLANYLRKFAQNKAEQREDEQNKREIERLMKEEEIEKQREELMKKEEEEIKLMEENIRKEKEAEERRKRELEELARRKEEVANIPPKLPALLEEEELVEFGDNKLHELAAKQGANLIQIAKDENISIAARNSQGLTIRDIAEQNNIAENVKQIDNYVTELVSSENFKALSDLVVNGFKNIQSIIESRFGNAEQMNENEMNAQVDYVYRNLPELEEKLRKVKEAIESNDLRLLKMTLDRKILAFLRDEQGKTSVQLALEKGNVEMALFLVEKYPSLAKLNDCQGRFASDYLQSIDKRTLNELQQGQYELLEKLLKH